MSTLIITEHPSPYWTDKFKKEAKMSNAVVLVPEFPHERYSYQQGVKMESGLAEFSGSLDIDDAVSVLAKYHYLQIDFFNDDDPYAPSLYETLECLFKVTRKHWEWLQNNITDIAMDEFYLLHGKNAFLWARFYETIRKAFSNANFAYVNDTPSDVLWLEDSVNNKKLRRFVKGTI